MHCVDVIVCRCVNRKLYIYDVSLADVAQLVEMSFHAPNDYGLIPSQGVYGL